jgi:uptake hydrogenase large subunit
VAAPIHPAAPAGRDSAGDAGDRERAPHAPRRADVPPAESQQDGDGFGAINAARGSLGHWLRIRDGKIANYQVITPTAWNGSPRDTAGRRGHWEESFLGLEIRDPENPVELFHIVRSHDACLVCTVHVATTKGASRAFTFW